MAKRVCKKVSLVLYRQTLWLQYEHVQPIQKSFGSPLVACESEAQSFFEKYNMQWKGSFIMTDAFMHIIFRFFAE